MVRPENKAADHWKTAWVCWDPYDVWHRLVRKHPVCVENPGGTTGRMTSSTAREFWVTVADFPDPLQDALFVIAHADGFETALAALDEAISEHLAARNDEARTDRPKRAAASSAKKARRTNRAFPRPATAAG